MAMAADVEDLGLLISILHSASAAVWRNVEHTLRVLRPRWSSLAVDTWSREANQSSVSVRLSVLTQRAGVLSLFSRVLFLDTAPRYDVPSHVRPSFSYRLHWHACFGNDYASRWTTRGAHSEGLPTLLAGVDADVYVPDELPIHRLTGLLSQSARSSAAAVAQAEARAEEVWVRGQVPACAAAVSESAGTAAAGAGTAATTASAQLCEVVSPEHAPLWASPRNLADLAIERRRSFGELGMYLRPLGLGNCCGRQNAAATERVRRQSGAAVATLSRGPYCPPSTFFVFHRSQLQRLLASFRLWQRAWDARALTRDAKRLRWEYVACSMLAPGEGGLLLHYNHSDLEKGQ